MHDDKTELVHFATESGFSTTAALRSGSIDGAGGEAVFYTGYTGYEECLTDPSYKGQVLVFAYPLIGNYGVRPERFESDEIQPELVVARQLTDDVAEWLDDEGVPSVDSLDTRDLVLEIREKGSMTCSLGVDEYEAMTGACGVQSVSEIVEMPDRVGVETIHHYNLEAETTIAILDCGVKQSMIDQFVDRGCHVARLPNDVDPVVVESMDPSVVFVSNGPGDPQNYGHVVETVQAFSGWRPIAGICLGQQVIALAHDGDTEQMKFGHRGSNQPVKPHDGAVKMSTQNHSFEVTDPGSLKITEHNVNDGSAEGLRDEQLQIVARQYHPEAAPGPRDSFEFFDRVLEMA